MSVLNGVKKVVTKIGNAQKEVLDAVCDRLGVPLCRYTSITTISATGATTITGAQILGGYFIYSGNGAATWTTPTGAQLSAAVWANDTTGGSYNQVVGTRIDFEVRNTGNNTLTLAAGASGVTLFSGNTNTVATVNTRRFFAILTAADTWTIYSGPAGAH